MAVDACSQVLGISVQNAADALQEYIKDPKAPRFAKLTEEQHEKMRAAVADERDDPSYDGDDFFAAMGKYDLKNRPHERDLLKAEIFMEEIIQDFFTGKEVPEATHRGQYICIS